MIYEDSPPALVQQISPLPPSCAPQQPSGQSNLLKWESGYISPCDSFENATLTTSLPCLNDRWEKGSPLSGFCLSWGQVQASFPGREAPNTDPAPACLPTPAPASLCALTTPTHTWGRCRRPFRLSQVPPTQEGQSSANASPVHRGDSWLTAVRLKAAKEQAHLL